MFFIAFLVVSLLAGDLRMSTQDLKLVEEAMVSSFQLNDPELDKLLLDANQAKIMRLKMLLAREARGFFMSCSRLLFLQF